MAAHGCNPGARWSMAETSASQGSLTSQPSCSSWLQVPWKTLFQKTSWRTIKDLVLTSDLYTCTHGCVHPLFNLPTHSTHTCRERTQKYEWMGEGKWLGRDGKTRKGIRRRRKGRGFILNSVSWDVSYTKCFCLLNVGSSIRWCWEINRGQIWARHLGQLRNLFLPTSQWCDHRASGWMKS